MKIKVTEAKLLFEADISSYCMEEVVKKGKLIDYLVGALRESSDREYAFIWGSPKLTISGEVEV